MTLKKHLLFLSLVLQCHFLPLSEIRKWKLKSFAEVSVELDFVPGPSVKVCTPFPKVCVTGHIFWVTFWSSLSMHRVTLSPNNRFLTTVIF